MHVEKYAQALGEDLARVAALGDESVARAAELLAAALETSVGRRLQEALAEAALELSGQLEQGRIEVRVAGSDPELVYVDDEPPPAQDADAELSARITLRLPEGLKARVDTAATASGVSVNTWLVQTLSRRLESRPSTGGSRHRLTGYGRN